MQVNLPIPFPVINLLRFVIFPGQCMFILLAGTVVVTTSEDRPVCYLRDGSHFGEVALALNLFRVSFTIFYSKLAHNMEA